MVRVQNLIGQLLSWINTTRNGPKAFWGTTGLICLPVMFLSDDSDGEIIRKILLFVFSPVITLALFSSLSAILILWTEVVLPIAKYIQRRFSS